MNVLGVPKYPKMNILGVLNCPKINVLGVPTYPKMNVLGAPKLIYWVSQNEYTGCPKMNSLNFRNLV